jgi:predicted PurR-regulated permease PerM
VVVLAGLIIVLLWVLRSEILYIGVAVFIAVLLSPPVIWLEHHGVRRGYGATLVFVIGLLIFSGLVFLFGAPLVSAVTRFSHQVPGLVRQAENGRGQIGHLVRRFHLQQWVSKNLPKLSTLVGSVSKPALSVGAAAASTLVALVTIAILSFFLLLEAPILTRGFLGLFPTARADRLVRVSREVSRSVTGYMLGDILTSIAAGLIVFITLTILGVPFALLLGLWVALVDLLPLIGGLLAGVPTVIVALFHSPVAGIVMFAVFIAYQLFENHVLNPIVMSRTVRLSPLWVLLSVLVFAKLGFQVGGGFGGFIGALIGIPLGGALQVAIREFRRPVMPSEVGDQEDPAPIS